MDSTRNEIKKQLIKYYQSLGLTVKTSTKALGHQGFFRLNRIDVSKNLKDERVIPTLLHEFAHYVVYKISPLCNDLSPIFRKSDDIMYKELISVTNLVDKYSTFQTLLKEKVNVQDLISKYESTIKQTYPKFKRSEKFKEFDKYSKKSDCKYLLKHDAVRVIHWFSYKTYSIMNIEQDFPNMPQEFVAYLKLKSCQRKQSSISRRINKLNKYYNQPTELFARFIEGLYLDKEETTRLAPNTTEIFKQLLNENYYPEINKLLGIVKISL